MSLKKQMLLTTRRRELLNCDDASFVADFRLSTSIIAHILELFFNFMTFLFTPVKLIGGGAAKRKCF